MSRLGRDLTRGSIPKHLLAVALPMLLGNLINTSYSIVNAIWIGRILGKEAIGAVAVSFPIVFIFVAVASGATMATTILVSQYYGARNFVQVEKTVGTSFLMAIILGIVLSIAGILSSDAVLKLLGTPAGIFPMASPYLKLSFVGFTFIYLSFLVTSVLRGVGDTRTPLMFMTAGVIVNAILDPFLIMGIGPFPRLGLNGGAVASIVSSLVALVFGIIYLNKKGDIIAVRIHTMRIDPGLALLIGKIGFPSMLQQGAVSLGMAVITSLVNNFGASATAAFGAAGRIDAVAFLPAMSIGMAVSAIAGQNLGAHMIDRVRQTFKWGMIMTICISAFFSIVFVSFPDQLISLFVKDPEVIAIGRNYLRIVAPSSIMFAIMFVSNGVINGAGHTMITLVFTLLSLWGIRVPVATMLSRTTLGLNGVWIGFSVGFAAMMIISLLWYKSGKWQKQVIKAGIPQSLSQSAEEPLAADEPPSRSVAGI